RPRYPAWTAPTRLSSRIPRIRSPIRHVGNCELDRTLEGALNDSRLRSRDCYEVEPAMASPPDSRSAPGLFGGGARPTPKARPVPTERLLPWWLFLPALALLHLSHPLTWGVHTDPSLWFPTLGIGLALVAWFGPRAGMLLALDGLLVVFQAWLVGP